MKPIDLAAIQQFVNDNIGTFHQAKIQTLGNLKLRQLLRRKNPYLFRAKNILLAQDLIENLLQAHVSSSEEELFGRFLESLAIFIVEQTGDGHQSNRAGIDVEFTRHNTYVLMQIKSGPNWGNSSQQHRLAQDFEHALAAIRAKRGDEIIVQPVLGICYGKTRTRYLRGYLKVVGQNFWYYISNNPQLYTQIIEPLGYEAKKHTTDFEEQQARIINLFTLEFARDFCDDGVIDWERLLAFNSGNLDLPGALDKR